jgi:nucleoside-diphosphate-sugar epimerase
VSNMKILLTGSRGMVGRNIAEHYRASDHVILSPTSAMLNLLEAEAVKNYISVNKPDMIIHAAGIVGGIQANMAQPVRFLLDNMQMGLNVLVAAKACNVKNFMNLGSSCMYPRDAENPLSEYMIARGELEPTNEGYALAKIVSAKLCEYMATEDASKNYKTIIPCNLYGRYDKYDPQHSHLIPAVIRKLDEAKREGQKTVDVWGDGKARREFMCAGDLADFVFFAIDRFDEMPQNLNVGLGHDYSITEYYEAVALVVGFDGSFEHDLSKPVGMKQKLVDITELNDFGWHYKTQLADGIRQAYDFYKKGQNNEV